MRFAGKLFLTRQILLFPNKFFILFWKSVIRDETLHAHVKVVLFPQSQNRLHHGGKRGAKIYAEVVKFGTTTDGTHITSPNRLTIARALQLALDDAGLDGSEIGYINTHGTGTTAGDVTETGATYDVFKRV